jgi:hypothetical protein
MCNDGPDGGITLDKDFVVDFGAVDVPGSGASFSLRQGA